MISRRGTFRLVNFYDPRSPAPFVLEPRHAACQESARSGDEQKTLQPGDMYRIPGNVRHRVIALDEPVKALDIFYPIREDYL